MQKKEIGSFEDCFISENHALSKEISWLINSKKFEEFLASIGLKKSIVFSNLLDPLADWGENKIVQSFAINRTFNLINPLKFDPVNKDTVIDIYANKIKEQFHSFFIENNRNLLVGPDIYKFINEQENELYALTLMFGLTDEMLAIYSGLSLFSKK